MNDTATNPITSDNQHTLQWSAFKPRAIASKPLNLTNFDNPLPFISMASENDKRKWETREEENDIGRKKQHVNGDRSPSSDGHSTDKGSVTDINATSVEAKARRKAQNRAAQRAFRERKEKYVQELEGKIQQMEQAHKQERDRLLENNQNLTSLIQKLEAEVLSLKNMSPAMSDGKGDTARSNFSGSPQPSDQSSVGREATDVSVAREDAGLKKSGSQRSIGSRYCGSSCRTTKDGISFCAKLKEEVCSSAFERLLSESIFDHSGEVNNAIEPVPIVTTEMSIGLQNDGNPQRGRKFSTFQKKFLIDSNENDEYDLSSGTSEAFQHEPHPDTLQSGKQLITCSQVWERLCEHPQFEEFDIEELCVQLKAKAKCSGSGPVIEEDELHEVLEALESKLLQDNRA